MSWFKTCGLSRLPIYDNEEVYLFPLEQNLENERCYSTALWQPTQMGFTCKYGDYGKGYDCHGLGFDYLINSLKSQVIENDIIDKKNISEKTFFESVHEQELFIPTFIPEEFNGIKIDKVRIDFVMFRKDIFESVLKYKFEKYVGEDKGNVGHNNSYINYNFYDLENKIEEFISLWNGKYFDNSSVDSNPLLKILYNLMNIRRDHYMSSLYLITDRDLLNPELTRECLITRYIKKFMESSRILWLPSLFEGSQEREEGIEYLSKEILNSIDGTRKKYTEE
ncbi:MAG: hypothetical protein WC284_16615 [Candidimonas sp.]